MTTQEEKEIIEGNKKFANFMNFKTWVYNGEPVGYYDLDIVKYSVYRDGMGHRPHACFYEELKFHSSYEWLMEVVEKVERMNLICPNSGIVFSVDIIIEYNYCQIVDEDNAGIVQFDGYGEDGNKKKAIWKALLKFIEWYNKNYSE